MRLEERPTPAAGPDDVLVDVEVAGVNFGDTMIRRGEYRRDQTLSMAPGCEVVGRIAVAGGGAARLSGPASRVGSRPAAAMPTA
jgi:NADPH2:quinone reductase